jgi:hypothetical protein
MHGTFEITICKICRRPQHSLMMFDSEGILPPVVFCPEMPKDVIVLMRNYRCGCCRCAGMEFPEKSPVLN